jgi:translation initiation factor 2 alpha subunit (eIF-2alpha)
MTYIYPNKTPINNKIVIVRIKEINNLNVVGELIDYNNMTAYILLSELSKKKRFNINKLVSIGKEIPAQIIGFNEETNYVECSIKTLTNDDITQHSNLRLTYIKSYNLWKYVFMKLKPEIEMDYNKIDSMELYIFMEKTLWKIMNYLEDNSELNLLELENTELYTDIFEDITVVEKLFQYLIHSSKNTEILKIITEYDVEKVKTIIDAYGLIKINPVKQTKYVEFTAITYEIEGVYNLKNAFDYKSFEKYEEFMVNYDITLLYLTGNKYSLSLKQKIPKNEDIEIIYNYFIQEIIKRCKMNNIELKI